MYSASSGGSVVCACAWLAQPRVCQSEAAEALLSAQDINPWQVALQCLLCPITCPLMCAFNCCLGCCLLSALGTAAAMGAGQGGPQAQQHPHHA